MSDNYMLRDSIMAPMWRCQRRCEATTQDADLCTTICDSAQTLVNSMHAYSPALGAIHTRMGAANYIEVVEFDVEPEPEQYEE